MLTPEDREMLEMAFLSLQAVRRTVGWEHPRVDLLDRAINDVEIFLEDDYAESTESE